MRITPEKPLGESSWYIRGAHVLDPADESGGRGSIRALWLREGVVEEAPPDPPAGACVVDATGLTAVPALLDLHAHVREPGDEAAETVASGARAAAAGGFGRVVCMPNTHPPIDTPDRVHAFLNASAAAGSGPMLLPTACLTRGRAGREPTDLAALAEAGAVGFTDDGSTVADDTLMRHAMEEASRQNLLVMDHAQDPAAERSGVMHAGRRSRELGLPGIPVEAEVFVVERDIRLARETGCALHIQHVSSAAGVDALRRARAEGLPVSAEITPHHLALCDADVCGENTSLKMNPPLRTKADRDALVNALCDGTVSCLATDHAPHTPAAKARGFRQAPFGTIGLETAVGVSWTHLVQPGRMTPIRWLRLWTTGPASVLGCAAPSLRVGAPADVALLDLDTPWTVEPDLFESRSRNSCFAGRTLVGKCRMLFCAGRRVWSA